MTSRAQQKSPYRKVFPILGLIGVFGTLPCFATPVTFEFNNSIGERVTFIASFTIDSNDLPAGPATITNLITNSSASFSDSSRTLTWDHPDLVEAKGSIETTGPSGDFEIIWQTGPQENPTSVAAAMVLFWGAAGPTTKSAGMGAWSVERVGDQTAIPEPASGVLMITGLIGLVVYARWNARRSSPRQP